MIDDQRHFLSLWQRPPARLTAEQVAWALNCAAHDIPTLVAAGLLPPLGSPTANAVKYFATVDILERAADRVWLSQVTHTIQGHWRHKNQRRIKSGPPRPRPAPVPAAAARRPAITIASPFRP